MTPGQLDDRILVVEDVPDIQRLIARLLEEEGAEVVVAENGRVALDRVCEAMQSGRPFHCVLMDMKMPVLGGCEAARGMREAGYTGGIVAVTGWVVPGHREECLAAGCNDYLAKPFRADQLLSMAKKWCHPETASENSEPPDDGPAEI
jgi:CheY-like chemotaxis protein